MSSEYDFIASLILAQTNLYKFGGPILIGLGSVSCILSFAVFTEKNLRKNPCSIYLLAFTAVNFLVIYTSILWSTLPLGYNIDPSLYNLGFCRFRFYTIVLFTGLSPSYIILASVDRILLTSRNALTRRRSTSRLAYICIITVTLFWVLSQTHAIFFTNITQIAPGYSFCYFQPGIYLEFIGYYSVIVKGILFPFLMIALGLWTVKNVQNVGRVAPAPDLSAIGTTTVGGNLRSTHSKDRQLIRILLLDITIYVICNVVILVILMYQQFFQYQITSYVQLELQTFLLTTGTIISYIPYCIGSYTNLLVSKTFRREVKKFLMRNLIFCLHQPR